MTEERTDEDVVRDALLNLHAWKEPCDALKRLLARIERQQYWIDRFQGLAAEKGLSEHALEERIEKLREALEEMVTATESWNEAVQTIIGRQPRTGIDLEHARAALAEEES